LKTENELVRPETGNGNGRFDITFPSAGNGADQDEEWCQVVLDGAPRRIRFHDYGDIYDVPGLYEQLFYDELRCQSPAVVCGLFADLLEADDFPAEGLRVLDVGAGNGMVGEELARLGVDTIVGVDIIREAAEAAERDRPGLYEDYLVTDLTAMPSRVRRALAEYRFNCLTSVAALGFGDIPPLAFAEAYNFVSDGGWIAFCIKDRFLEDGEESGFNRLVRWMLENQVMDIRTQRRYRHRLSIHGEPLHYEAVVATKRADVSLDWARQAG
jgi:predicted TPR repeat methyltransferase